MILFMLGPALTGPLVIPAVLIAGTWVVIGGTLYLVL